MATINFFVSAKKRKIAPIYVRLSDGRGCDLIVKSGLVVEPDHWSNKTQTIKQRIPNKKDSSLKNKLAKLREFIDEENRNYTNIKSKDWLKNVINKFHNVKEEGSNNLNSYIESFISKARKGELKTNGAMNFADGTMRALGGFKRIFNEYQGIYTPDRLEELRKQEKEPRPLKIIDFEDITIDFYNDFVAFLSNEGYKVNTIGKFIKQLKYLMRKALIEGKHKNRQFMEVAFTGFTEESHAIYLTPEEVEKIYNYDLSAFPRMEIARDAFIILCETALRISDYRQIDVNIKVLHGKKYINIFQTKTKEPVVIPLTKRMDAILNKYNGKLPRIPEQHVNIHIKTIAKWCEIDEEIRWPAQKFGKKFTASAKKYELITNHTGRRTACTNMYRAGIPTIDIMKISGHKTEKSFLTYIRITPEEVAERLSEHPYFSGDILKAV
jgi:integrase